MTQARRCIAFRFLTTLTHKQEDILIAGFQSIILRVKKSIGLVLQILKSKPYTLLANEQTKSIISMLEIGKNNIDDFVWLHKTGETEYTFKFSSYFFDSLNPVALPSRLKHLTNFSSKIREYINGKFKNEICQRMKIKQTDVMVIFSEVEERWN